MLEVNHQEKAGAISKTRIIIAADRAAQAEEILDLAINLIDDTPEQQMTLLGITPMGPEASIRESGSAEVLKRELEDLARRQPRVTGLGRSIVSERAWQQVSELKVDTESETVLLLPWRSDDHRLRRDLAQVLRDPPCDVAIVHSPMPPARIQRILLPVRGGAFAVLSLQLAVQMARSVGAEVTLLRVLPADDDAPSRALREAFTGLSDIFPEIVTEVQVVGDPTATILKMLSDHQAIVLGASAGQSESPIGLLASLILHRRDITTLVVRTRESFRMPAASGFDSGLPVLVRLEKWLDDNTFHKSEFSSSGKLIDLKREQGLKISLGLPTLNNESTIRSIITAIKGSLVDDVPLLDEIVVIDSGSTDGTRRIAAAMGVQSYASPHVLRSHGSQRGKGESLWKSLYLLKGDLILWMETDIINPDPRAILGIAGPLLTDGRIQYVKGFHRGDPRGPSVGPDAMTALLLRPLISLLFPDLAGIVLPLAGCHGGRRSALERIPFYSGYGVEFGILLDILERFGLGSIAQVDLGKVVRSNTGHRHILDEKTAFSVLQVCLGRLASGDLVDSELAMERTIKLLRADRDRLHLEEIDAKEQQRPPMLVVKEYRGRHVAAPVACQ
jgi:glucosyl-3-phosphoglycerate synthase